MEDAAASTYLLPVISLFISAVAAAVGALLATVNMPVPQAISLAALYAQTGIIHLDGLADFFDGINAKGGPEVKRAVLKDPHIGAAGASALFIILFLEFASILKAKPDFLSLLRVLLLSDISSRLSIVLMLQGKRFNEGIGKMFMERARRWHPLAFIGISLVMLPITGLEVVVAIAVGASVAATIYEVSVAAFGGASGDPLGAASEISRAITVILLCSRF